jgi:hypothetical protein
MKVERIAGAVSSISGRDSDLTDPCDTPACVVMAFVPPLICVSHDEARSERAQ